MTSLPIHEITVHAGARSLTLWFRAHPSPEQLIEAIAARESEWIDEPHFRRLVEWARKGRYASVKRELWANPVEEAK